MKRIGLLSIALLTLSAQAPGGPPVHHLVYQFGYNTPVASSGNGTGTVTIDMSPAADGGITISGTDFWWNTVRPRATNTCELYAGGGISCSERPYALSPIQLTIFPLLARGYFNGLTAAGSTATRKYTIKAAMIPGASTMAGNLNTWDCLYTLHGKGPIPNAKHFVLITAQGTLTQVTGRNFKASSKQRISYDTVAKVPLAVSDARTYLPMRSVYSNATVELKLTKDSMGNR